MLSAAVAKPKTDQWKLAAEASWTSLLPGCSRTWQFKAEPNVKPCLTGPQNTTTCPIHISAKEDTNGAKDRRGLIWDAVGPF